MKKVGEINKLKKIVNSYKKSNLKTALVHGVFDVLHIGHILYFEEAKKIADKLIVSITSDKFVKKAPGRPIFNINNRVKMLSALKVVDHIIVSNNVTAVENILEIKPDYFVKGQDYKTTKEDITKNIQKEIKAIHSVSGKFITTSTKMFSSSKIINNQMGFLDNEIINYLKKIKKEKLKQKIKENFSKKINKKVLVIGEPVVDTYEYVISQGKSLKSNILSTRHQYAKKYGGGSILVSNFLSEFIKNVDLLAFGNKNNKSIYKNYLNKKVKVKLVNDNQVKIINKTRYIDEYSGNRLYQVNYNDVDKLKTSSEKKFLNYFKKNVKKYDHIIVFDFGHGYLFNQIVKEIVKHKNKLFINCQSNSSNFGYNLANKYKKGHSISMDEQEFRLTAHDKSSDLITLLKKNSNYINKFNSFIVTAGKSGCFICKKNKINFIPSFFKFTKDTTGCGDTFFSAYIVGKILGKFHEKELAIISHLAAWLHANEEGNKNSVNSEKLIKLAEVTLK